MGWESETRTVGDFISTQSMSFGISSSAKLQPQWRLLNKTEDLCWRLFRQLLEKDSCPQSTTGCNLYPEEVGEPSRCCHQNQAKG